MNTAKIVRFHSLGDADVLQIEELPLDEPKDGEVRLKVEAIGLNRSEVLFRKGQYEPPTLPSRLGYEASGVIDAVGPGVTTVKIGDRVSTVPAFSMRNYGVYGESAIVPAYAVSPYPENLSAIEGAAIWVQYLTTYYAFVDMGHLQAGQHVLITAASSSTGNSAIEMARLLGATSIATTRTAAKKQALLEAGADHVIVTDEEDLVARVQEITNGKGAELIYDCIGGSTLASLGDAAAQFGRILLYGTLNRETPVYPIRAAFQRQFTLQAYTIFRFTGDPEGEAFARGKQFVFDALKDGRLKPIIAKTFPLAEIRQAQQYMESNQQMGKIVVTVA